TDSILNELSSDGSFWLVPRGQPQCSLQRTQYSNQPNAIDDRFVNYMIARYAAYHNVFWSLCNEWGNARGTLTYWNHMGNLIRASDKWMVSPANTSAMRPLSSHQRVPIFVNGPPPTPPPDMGWPGVTTGAVDAVFAFFGSSWPSYAIIQNGDRSKPTGDQSVN